MDRDEVMKLALEAGFKRDIHGIYQPRRNETDCDCSPELERFAQLIVRECAKVVFEKTGPKSALNVLEHFGVKE